MTLGRNNTNEGETADRVPSDERPKPSVEDVPDEIVEKALSWATRYAACPECGTEQFFFERPGWNTTVKCGHCGEKVKMIG